MGALKIELVTKDYIDSDPYYQECRKTISSSPEFNMALKERDLATADRRLRLLMDLKGVECSKEEDLKLRVAHNIRKLAGTGRYVAENIFSEGDFRHGNQIFGRDAKRWAAITIGDIFTSEAVIGDLNGSWDFWHE